MSSIYRAPELPWDDGQDGRRLWAIGAILFAIIFVVGVVVPFIDLPNKDRSELEELPPQLAKVIERKKKGRAKAGTET